jgi:hypothetical protein
MHLILNLGKRNTVGQDVGNVQRDMGIFCVWTFIRLYPMLSDTGLIRKNFPDVGPSISLEQVGYHSNTGVGMFSKLST